MPPSRRRYPRTEVHIITDISLTSAASPTKDRGLFAVLGEGGALIESDTNYPIGSLLLFRFRLPADPEEFCCQGVVCNEVDGGGSGVEFLGLDPHDRDRLTAFVAHHVRPDPGPVG